MRALLLLGLVGCIADSRELAPSGGMSEPRPPADAMFTLPAVDRATMKPWITAGAFDN